MKELFCTATGDLKKVLDTYEAPEGVKNNVARRAGAIVGKGGFKITDVEDAILDSMVINGGMPHWGVVQKNVGNRARDAYKKAKKIF